MEKPSEKEIDRRRFWIIGIVVSGIILGLAAAPALADFARAVDYSWEDGDGKCVETHSQIGDDSTHATFTHAFGKRESFQIPRVPRIHCFRSWPRSSLKFRAATWLVKWEQDEWSLCVSSDWSYNDEDSDNAAITSHYVGGLPCGPGYYANFGWGQTERNNEFQGGWIFSGRRRWK